MGLLTCLCGQPAAYQHSSQDKTAGNPTDAQAAHCPGPSQAPNKHQPKQLYPSSAAAAGASSVGLTGSVCQRAQLSAAHTSVHGSQTPCKASGAISSSASISHANDISSHAAVHAAVLPSLAWATVVETHEGGMSEYIQKESVQSLEPLSTRSQQSLAGASKRKTGDCSSPIKSVTSILLRDDSPHSASSRPVTPHIIASPPNPGGFSLFNALSAFRGKDTSNAPTPWQQHSNAGGSKGQHVMGSMSLSQIPQGFTGGNISLGQHAAEATSQGIHSLSPGVMQQASGDGHVTQGPPTMQGMQDATRMVGALAVIGEGAGRGAHSGGPSSSTNGAGSSSTHIDGFAGFGRFTSEAPTAKLQPMQGVLQPAAAIPCRLSQTHYNETYPYRSDPDGMGIAASQDASHAGGGIRDGAHSVNVNSFLMRNTAGGVGAAGYEAQGQTNSVSCPFSVISDPYGNSLTDSVAHLVSQQGWDMDSPPMYGLQDPVKARRAREKAELLVAARLIGSVLPDVVVHKPIGQGAHGKVYKGTLASRSVAIKVIRQDMDANAAAAMLAAARQQQKARQQQQTQGDADGAAAMPPPPPELPLSAEQLRLLEGMVGASAYHPNIVKTYRVALQPAHMHGAPAYIITRGGTEMKPLWATENIHLRSEVLVAYASHALSRKNTSPFSRSMTQHSAASHATSKHALLRSGLSGLQRYTGSTSGHSSAASHGQGSGALGSHVRGVSSSMHKQLQGQFTPAFMSAAGPERTWASPSQEPATNAPAPSSAPQVLFDKEGMLLLQQAAAQHAAAASSTAGGMPPTYLDGWKTSDPQGRSSPKSGMDVAATYGTPCLPHMGSNVLTRGSVVATMPPLQEEETTEHGTDSFCNPGTMPHPTGNSSTSAATPAGHQAPSSGAHSAYQADESATLGLPLLPTSMQAVFASGEGSMLHPDEHLVFSSIGHNSHASSKRISRASSALATRSSLASPSPTRTTLVRSVSSLTSAAGARPVLGSTASITAQGSTAGGLTAHMTWDILQQALASEEGRPIPTVLMSPAARPTQVTHGSGDHAQGSGYQFLSPRQVAPVVPGYAPPSPFHSMHAVSAPSGCGALFNGNADSSVHMLPGPRTSQLMYQTGASGSSVNSLVISGQDSGLPDSARGSQSGSGKALTSSRGAGVGGPAACHGSNAAAAGPAAVDAAAELANCRTDAGYGSIAASMQAAAGMTTAKKLHVGSTPAADASIPAVHTVSEHATMTSAATNAAFEQSLMALAVASKESASNFNPSKSSTSYSQAAGSASGGHSMLDSQQGYMMNNVFLSSQSTGAGGSGSQAGGQAASRQAGGRLRPTDHSGPSHARSALVSADMNVQGMEEHPSIANAPGMHARSGHGSASGSGSGLMGLRMWSPDPSGKHTWYTFLVQELCSKGNLKDAILKGTFHLVTPLPAAPGGCSSSVKVTHGSVARGGSTTTSTPIRGEEDNTHVGAHAHAGAGFEIERKEQCRDVAVTETSPNASSGAMLMETSTQQDHGSGAEASGNDGVSSAAAAVISISTHPLLQPLPQPTSSAPMSMIQQQGPAPRSAADSGYGQQSLPSQNTDSALRRYSQASNNAADASVAKSQPMPGNGPSCVVAGTVGSVSDKRMQTILMGQLIDTAKEAASAMVYLHSKRLMHGDLKSQNVLLQASRSDPRGFVCKLADFGTSHLMGAGQDNLLVTNFGTVTHQPPETIRDNVVSLKGDVYAFGVLLWELYCAAAPFAHYTLFQLLSAVVQYDERPQFPSHCPKGYAALAQRCMVRLPEQRPDFPGILEALSELRSSVPSMLMVPYVEAQTEVARIMTSHIQIASGILVSGLYSNLTSATGSMDRNVLQQLTADGSQRNVISGLINAGTGNAWAHAGSKGNHGVPAVPALVGVPTGAGPAGVSSGLGAQSGGGGGGVGGGGGGGSGMGSRVYATMGFLSFGKRGTPEADVGQIDVRLQRAAGGAPGLSQGSYT